MSEATLCNCARIARRVRQFNSLILRHEIRLEVATGAMRGYYDFGAGFAAIEKVI